MLNLDGIFVQDDINAIRIYTRTRFANDKALLAPEALTLYEEGYMNKAEIKSLCEVFYGHPLEEPMQTYVPDEIIQNFRGSGLVPVSCTPINRKITLLAVDDFPYEKDIRYMNYDIEIKSTTLNYYLEIYTKVYGLHPCLREVPVKLLFDAIIREALDFGAIDITIDSLNKCTRVFYNVRKKKIDSPRIFSHEFIYDLIELITIKSPMDKQSGKPMDLDIDINKYYRGRVQINPNIYGFSITIRLLPNEMFNTTLEELNLSEKAVNFVRTAFYDKTPGLRLMVGPTMSGKNTTLLTVIADLAKRGTDKVVSIEMPVEQKLPGVIQISAGKEEEFKANTESMIKANPDFLYITEIRDSIGLAVVNIANTGKCVFSTIHANSVSATISRLMDVTGLSQDRVIQTLHSVCYQILQRDETTDTLKPVDRFLWFTDDIKSRLYGKPLGEVIRIIEEEEDGD